MYWRIKNKQENGQKKKGQNDKQEVCKTCTVHRKLKIEEHELNYKPKVNSSAPEVLAVVNWDLEEKM